MKLIPIITIGRQYGSGGRAIAKALAEQYNIPLYDKELINRVSKETGICGEVFKEMDEKQDEQPAVGFWAGMTYNPFCFASHQILSGDSLFKMQSQTIQHIAEEGPCVIVGRCADYVLRDHQPLVSVFITADWADRVKKVMDYENVDPEKAEDLILKQDKARSAYYNFYSKGTWGEAATYQLCLNSSKIGMEGCVKMIQAFVNQSLEKE